MFKKTSLVTTMALCVLTSAGCTVYSQGSLAGDRFSDTKGHWAEAAINTAVASGYVDGYEDGSFKPDAYISRAEFIKLVATATGTKVVGTSGSEWYRPYVDVLTERDVVRIDEFSNYNEKTTRLELTKIALREVREDVRNPNAIMGDSSYMYSAVKSGLIQGLAGGELGGDEKTTRAQALTIIERIKSLKKGEEIQVDKYALSKAEIELNGHNMNTMLGVQPKISFPYTKEIGDGLTMILNSLKIVDMTDKENSDYNYIMNNSKSGSMSLDGKYVLLFDTTYKNTKEDSGVAFFPTQSVSLMGFGRIVLPNSVRPFQLFKGVEVNGVYALIIDKEDAENEIKSNSIHMIFRTPTGDIELY